MANLTYTNNGITFTDVKRVIHEAGGVAGKENYTVNGSPANPIKGGEIDTAIPAFNCVDIDWNGAQLGENKILNTTGEVLSKYKVAI